MIRKYTEIISLSVVLLFCSRVSAAPTLDQYQEDQNGFFNMGTSTSVKAAQTFTAGLTGLLDHLEIGCYSTAPTTWEIRETSAGVPSSTVLGSVLVSYSLSSGWNVIDLASEGIIVNAGTMYSIVTYHSEGGMERVYMKRPLLVDDPAVYTAGEAWKDTGNGWVRYRGDMQFRTYVDVSAYVSPPIAFNPKIPNTLIIQNFIKQFYTDHINHHANQGNLVYIEKSGNSDLLDPNDVIYIDPTNSSSKIVSLISNNNSEGEITEFNELSTDARPDNIENDFNSSAFLELSIYSEDSNLIVNSENYLKFWLADNAFPEKPITIQQVPLDPNIVYPVWDIRNIIDNNYRRLPLDYLISQNTDPTELPDPNTSVKMIELNTPYASFTLSTDREIIDINLDGKVDLEDYQLLLNDLGRQGILRSDIASEKGSGFVLGIPDGIVNEFDEGAFISEYDRLNPENPIQDFSGFFEDFESGQIHMPFTTSGNSPWIISDNSYSGDYCIESGNIEDSQSSILELNVNCPTGKISFYRKVSSEEYFDHLRFYVDSLERGKWSGEEDWKEVNYNVSPGTHNLKWVYQKDSSSSRGEDSAYIDDVNVL